MADHPTNSIKALKASFLARTFNKFPNFLRKKTAKLFWQVVSVIDVR